MHPPFVIFSLVVASCYNVVSFGSTGLTSVLCMLFFGAPQRAGPMNTTIYSDQPF
jgi:hypothetical protein